MQRKTTAPGQGFCPWLKRPHPHTPLYFFSLVDLWRNQVTNSQKTFLFNVQLVIGNSVSLHEGYPRIHVEGYLGGNFSQESDEQSCLFARVVSAPDPNLKNAQPLPTSALDALTCTYATCVHKKFWPYFRNLNQSHSNHMNKDFIMHDALDSSCLHIYLSNCTNV